jgi:hypothetical protein
MLLTSSAFPLLKQQARVSMAAVVSFCKQVLHSSHQRTAAFTAAAAATVSCGIADIAAVQNCRGLAGRLPHAFGTHCLV